LEATAEAMMPVKDPIRPGHSLFYDPITDYDGDGVVRLAVAAASGRRVSTAVLRCFPNTTLITRAVVSCSTHLAV
jgi:hypothetical protein